MANCIAHIYRDGKAECHRLGRGSSIATKTATWRTFVNARVSKYGEVTLSVIQNGKTLLDWTTAPEAPLYEVRKIAPPDATNYKKYQYKIIDVSDKNNIKHVDTVYTRKNATMIVKRDRAFELQEGVR